MLELQVTGKCYAVNCNTFADNIDCYPENSVPQYAEHGNAHLELIAELQVCVIRNHTIGIFKACMPGVVREQI